MPLSNERKDRAGGYMSGHTLKIEFGSFYQAYDKVEVNGMEYIPRYVKDQEATGKLHQARFKVGDYVKVKSSSATGFGGEHGKVVYMPDPGDWVGVEFAEYVADRGHLDGLVPVGHGWFFVPTDLEHTK